MGAAMIFDSAEPPPIPEKSGRRKSLTELRTSVIGLLRAKYFFPEFWNSILSAESYLLFTRWAHRLRLKITALNIWRNRHYHA